MKTMVLQQSLWLSALPLPKSHHQHRDIGEVVLPNGIPQCLMGLQGRPFGFLLLGSHTLASMLLFSLQVPFRSFGEMAQFPHRARTTHNLPTLEMYGACGVHTRYTGLARCIMDINEEIGDSPQRTYEPTCDGYSTIHRGLVVQRSCKHPSNLGCLIFKKESRNLLSEEIGFRAPQLQKPLHEQMQM
jgi:hypothetical protein